jgi:putative addiction module component (TIGR02574 family)
MNHSVEFAQIFELPPAERLQLVEDLWDSLIAREAELPVPEAILSELRARKKLFDANPDSGMSWDQVVRSLDEA